MILLLPAGSVGMGLAVSLGLLVEALCAIHALAGVAHVRLGAILKQIQPPLVASLIMMTILFVIDRYGVHSGSASGLRGVGLLALEYAAAVAIYLGALSLISKHSVMELREAVAHLVRPSRRRESPAQP
jgi:hypothetical protein